MLEELKTFGGIIGEWIYTNRDWLFSGLGITSIAIIFACFRGWKNRRALKRAEDAEAIEAAKSLPDHVASPLLKPSHADRLKYDPEYQKLLEKAGIEGMASAYAKPTRHRPASRRHKSSSIPFIIMTIIGIVAALYFYLGDSPLPKIIKDFTIMGFPESDE